MSSFDLSEYDVVLSDASSFAKGIKPGNFLHICYCHTPTRFLWTEEEAYLQSTKYPFYVKWLARPVLGWLKRWDYRAAQWPYLYIANSVNVKNRIQKYYDRDSMVIPPPVDTEFFAPQGERRDYFFAASRLEPYKKIDLIIRAFNELGWPLKVAGTGTDLEYLKKIAEPNIEFVGRVDDHQLRQMYSECRAFVFAAEEDAGIMVLEAQACGAPVIAYGAGGSLETVVPGKTGEFFVPQTQSALFQVLQRFDSTKYSPQSIREHALQFDKQIFKTRIKQFVEDKYRAHQAQKGQQQ
jgi:glycosyltransferase involved in cell wall biosynthesis